MNEMQWKPQKGSSVPLHLQIYNYLKRKIMHGEWTVETENSHQRELAKQFQVNRSTIVFLNEYFSEIATWSIPKGGFNIWIRLDSDISPKKLIDHALRTYPIKSGNSI